MITQAFHLALPVLHTATWLIGQVAQSPAATEAPKKQSEFERIATALGLLALAVGAMVVIAFWIRKRLLGPDDEEKGEGFTISELREMHQDGKISDVEFERAKRAIVSQSLNKINEDDEQKQ